MAQKQTSSRQGQGERKPPSRRSDVIRCDVCGEDYAITYRRCPFCDERPGRGGVGGKRTARNTRGGGYGGPVSPIQIVYLVVSMVLIIAALFIVFTKLGPLLFPNDPSSGSASSTGSSQSSGVGNPGTSAGSQSGASSQPGGSASSSSEGPDVQPTVTAEAISLSRTDFTLNPGEPYQILAAVSPADVESPVVWSSSDTTLATVDQNGVVTNVNQGTTKQSVTITAACDGVEATCIVYCKPGGTAGSTTPSGGTGTSSGTLTPNSTAVVNAANGLNIRSGPGSEHPKVASASNGATVTILEDCGNNWYKVDYGGGKTGYVSGDFISPK